MDTLTHALIGAVAGRAYRPADPIGVSPHQRTLVAALSAAFPDLDYLTFWIDPLSFLSDWHRGPTHSLLLLPVWALLLGHAWSWLFNRPEARGLFIRVAALALFSHILGDLITAYGTGIFYPLSNWRPGLGITFVIDPWLTALVALLLSVALLRAGPGLPRVGLVLLVGVLASHAMLQRSAEHQARDYANAEGLDPGSVRAIAQPLSPLHWKLVVPDASGYRVAHIRLTEQPGFPPAWAERLGVGEIQRGYRAPGRAEWARHILIDGQSDDAGLVAEAWRHELMSRFREFAGLPALYRIERSTRRQCVWFTDLRFTLPGLVPAFRYGLCRDDPSSPWQLFRIRRFTDDEIAPV